MKHMFRLVLLALLLAPVAHASSSNLPCTDLKERILNLDRQILCQGEGGSNPNLALMLERNYLAQMHESISCRSRELVTPILDLRTGKTRLNCNKINSKR